MLVKRPKGSNGQGYLKAIKLIILGEVVLFGGAYVIWRQLNYSRDFRYFVHNNCPSLLQLFYKIGKTANPMYDCETLDQKVWSVAKQSGK